MLPMPTATEKLSTYEQVKAEAILWNTQFCMPSFVCSS